MTKFRKYYEVIHNQSNPREVDITLFGRIGSYNTEPNNPLQALDFVRTFRSLEESYDRINVRISSPGGVVEEGLPIYNAIFRSKKDVHIYIEGAAFSMAAIIALAGKTVHIYKNGIFMLHAVSTMAMGNAKDLRDEADVLDIYDRAIMESIATKTKKTIADIKKNYFDYKDHYLNADAAKSEGFVDIIEESLAPNVPENFNTLPVNDIMEYYSKNESADSFLREMFNSGVRKVAAILNINTPKEMTKENAIIIINGTNLPADQKAALIALMSGVSNEDHQVVTGQLTAANTKVTDLTNQLTEANGKVNDLTGKLTKANETISGIKTSLGDIAKGETVDLISLVKEQKEKADQSTTGKTRLNKRGSDDFDTDDEEPWNNAPWNVNVREEIPIPSKKKD